jgi:hypothetical protein
MIDCAERPGHPPDRNLRGDRRSCPAGRQTRAAGVGRPGRSSRYLLSGVSPCRMVRGYCAAWQENGVLPGPRDSLRDAFRASGRDPGFIAAIIGFQSLWEPEDHPGNRAPGRNAHAFEVPPRWVAERALAWISTPRRCARSDSPPALEVVGLVRPSATSRCHAGSVRHFPGDDSVIGAGRLGALRLRTGAFALVLKPEAVPGHHPDGLLVASCLPIPSSGEWEAVRRPAALCGARGRCARADPGRGQEVREPGVRESGHQRVRAVPGPPGPPQRDATARFIGCIRLWIGQRHSQRRAGRVSPANCQTAADWLRQQTYWESRSSRCVRS